MQHAECRGTMEGEMDGWMVLIFIRGAGEEKAGLSLKRRYVRCTLWTVRSTIGKEKKNRSLGIGREALTGFDRL